MVYQIETQTVLETYKFNGNVLSHLLIINDPESFDIPNVEYVVRCGGSVNPKVMIVESGVMIPLRLSSEVYSRKGNDHLAGCSSLNYGTNPDLVKKFADNFDLVLPKIYADGSSVSIKVNRDQLSSLVEGFIPVTVSGVFLAGPHITKPVNGYIITGNCI